MAGVVSCSCLIKGRDGAKRDDVESIALIPEDCQTSNYAICAYVIDNQAALRPRKFQRVPGTFLAVPWDTFFCRLQLGRPGVVYFTEWTVFMGIQGISVPIALKLKSVSRLFHDFLSELRRKNRKSATLICSRIIRQVIFFWNFGGFCISFI